MRYMFSGITKTSLLVFHIGILPLSGYAQPAAVKWLPAVKTSKDQHTLSLLTAGRDGFCLLRWQDRRADAATGKVTPAQPLLTVLTSAGERLFDEPLPGFDTGDQFFCFAFANDSMMLVAYEAPDPVGGQTLFVRRLHLGDRRWSGPAEPVFIDPVNRAPAFGNAWFCRSADGRWYCLYRQHGTSGAPLASIAVFDNRLQFRWKRTVPLPVGNNRLYLRDVFCTNGGVAVLQAQVFDAATPGRPFDGPPAAYRVDGQPLFRAYDWTSEAPANSTALFLLSSDTAEVAAFYPSTGKKYTPSLELAEGPDGRIYCAGLSSEDKNEEAGGYFLYAIDPHTKEANMLQNAPLPASVRKAFLSEKAAAKKEPVVGLALRWLNWADDGRPWLLVERENYSLGSGRMEEAAMLRLDSTYRITAARKIEKFQRLQPGDPQNFASLVACRAPKGAWWLLWNRDHWPETKLMLTECRPSGTPADYLLDAATRSNVTLLPQTLTYREGVWYFVGESEYHERFRIGMLGKQ